LAFYQKSRERAFPLLCLLEAQQEGHLTTLKKRIAGFFEVISCSLKKTDGARCLYEKKD
jgi:hypothetical protein